MFELYLIEEKDLKYEVFREFVFEIFWKFSFKLKEVNMKL